MSKLISFNHKSNDPVPAFSNMLDDFFGDPWFSQKMPEMQTFRLDVKEDDVAYTIEAEVPGAKKKDITLDFSEGRLTIGVEAKEIPEGEKHKFLHRERRYSYMQRSIYLADADAQGAQAKLEHGELIIRVPKRSGLQSSKIEIE